MADHESTQYAKAYTNSPVQKLDPNELNGRVRRIFAEATLSSEIAIGEEITFAKLPANATIIQAEFSSDAGAGAGVLDLGWGAGAEGNEAADPNGIATGLAEATATIQAMDKIASPAFGKKFSEPVDIKAIATTATTASAAGKICKLELLYTID